MKIDTTLRTSRSRHLRRQARQVHPVVAQAYRRRASEVELEAWLHQVVLPTARR
jgi:hypothetical protein